jgi:hypothetical protein
MIVNRPWARRLLRWTVATACLMSLAVWALSTRWHFGVAVKRSFGLLSADVHYGVMQVSLDRRIHYCNYPMERTFMAAGFGLTRPWGENLGFGFERFKGGFQGSVDVMAPLGLFFVLTLGASIGLWWRETRLFPPGHCLVCGYDLTGANHQRCPECGTTCDIKQPVAPGVSPETPQFRRWLPKLGLVLSVLILLAWGGSLLLGYASRQPINVASVKTQAQASKVACAYMREHYPGATAQVVRVYSLDNAWCVVLQGPKGDYKIIRISKAFGAQDLGNISRGKVVLTEGNQIP